VRKLAILVTVSLAVALATNALAGGKKEREARAKPEQASGVFISATIEGGVAKWKLTVDGEGEKTFEMPANVIVMYADKNGNKQARQIRTPGKKAPEPKGNALIAQGEIVKVEKQGKNLALTLKTADGEVQLSLRDQLAVMYRKGADDKLTAMGISPAGGKGGGKKGEGGGKKGEGGARKGKNDQANPPANL